MGTADNLAFSKAEEPARGQLVQGLETLGLSGILISSGLAFPGYPRNVVLGLFCRRAEHMSKRQEGKRVMVVGGGIAGVWAGLSLSSAGVGVDIVERAEQIGGQAVGFGCKAIDSCQKCNVCLALSKFREVVQNGNIRIHLNSELTGLKHGPANNGLRAEVFHRGQLIDPSKCTACGLCAAACPAGAIERAADTLGASYYVIDRSKCVAAKGEDCRKCQDICPTAAIDIEAASESEELRVDAVLVTAGYEPYDPIGQGTYGYGVIPNVISGFDAEHQLGKTARIARPSDGKGPKSVAFIQCVGSRSEETEPAAFSGEYCSAVCCAYAMRMSRLLADQLPDSKITIFYMDLQRFGKDYETLYNDCREKVRLIRSRPSKLEAGPDGSILINYEDVSETAVKQDQFDLVVLSVGIRPAAGLRELAEMLDIGVNEHGFLDGGSCQKRGVFVAGTCTGPADIAGTIEQTSAVTSALLANLRSEVSNRRPQSVAG